MIVQGWMEDYIAIKQEFDEDENIFKKDSRVKAIKMDTKKQVVLLEYWNVEIHPSKIKTMVKKTGYEVTSIKWLKKGKPQRYNAP